MKIRSLTSGTTSPAQWLIDWFRGGPEADSGVTVDVTSAMGLAPLWYAVSTIAGHVGTLPLHVHKRVDGGSEPATTHPLYSILKTRPNEYQTAIVFKELLMVHALLQGNGRAAILRRGGVPSELIPMLPQATYTCMVEGKKWHVTQVDRHDRLRYVPIPDFNQGQWYKIPDEDVFHVPGLGYDGVSGKNLISVARDSIGLGLASQKAAGRSFKHGGKPGVVIEAPSGAFRSEKDAQEFINNFNNFHEGLDNFGKAALMREGMKLSTIAVSSRDAEWVAQRKFQRQEVALLFGLQSMPGDEDSVSYSSLEQKNIAYLQNCLMRWLVKWEQECDYKLLGKRAQRTHFTRFNIDAILRPDTKTKMETLAMAITARIYSPNECREFLDKLPYPGGDEFENPAITPGASDDKDDDTPVAPEDASRRAVQSRLEHLISVEAGHVVRAAKYAATKNYLQWLEGFYSKKWRNTMSEAVNAICGNDAVALAHCEEHYHELLEVTGMVTPEGLADAVAELVQAWPDKAERLTNQLLSKELTNV